MDQPMIQMYTNFEVAQCSASTEGFHDSDFTSNTKNHKFITCWSNVNDRSLQGRECFDDKALTCISVMQHATYLKVYKLKLSTYIVRDITDISTRTVFPIVPPIGDRIRPSQFGKYFAPEQIFQKPPTNRNYEWDARMLSL